MYLRYNRVRGEEFLPRTSAEAFFFVHYLVLRRFFFASNIWNPALPSSMRETAFTNYNNVYVTKIVTKNWQ